MSEREGYWVFKVRQLKDELDVIIYQRPRFLTR
jgi:hypothetical protein